MTDYDRWLLPDDPPLIEWLQCGYCAWEDEEMKYSYITGKNMCDGCLENARLDWYAREPEEIEQITCSICGKHTGTDYYYIDELEKAYCTDCFEAELEDKKVMSPDEEREYLRWKRFSI